MHPRPYIAAMLPTTLWSIFVDASNPTLHSVRCDFCLFIACCLFPDRRRSVIHNGQVARRTFLSIYSLLIFHTLYLHEGFAAFGFLFLHSSGTSLGLVASLLVQKHFPGCKAPAAGLSSRSLLCVLSSYDSHHHMKPSLLFFPFFSLPLFLHLQPDENRTWKRGISRGWSCFYVFTISFESFDH